MSVVIVERSFLARILYKTTSEYTQVRREMKVSNIVLYCHKFSATTTKHSPGALPYICPICGKQFRTNKLSAHMATHTDARHVCLKMSCGKRFATRAALHRHTRAHLAGGPAHAAEGPSHAAAGPTHAAEAPELAGGGPAAYGCALCSARYHHKQSLNKHVKKQHAQVSKKFF